MRFEDHTPRNHRPFFRDMDDLVSSGYLVSVHGPDKNGRCVLGLVDGEALVVDERGSSFFANEDQSGALQVMPIIPHTRLAPAARDGALERINEFAEEWLAQRVHPDYPALRRFARERARDYGDNHPILNCLYGRSGEVWAAWKGVDDLTTSVGPFRDAGSALRAMIGKYAEPVLKPAAPSTFYMVLGVIDDVEAHYGISPHKIERDGPVAEWQLSDGLPGKRSSSDDAVDPVRALNNALRLPGSREIRFVNAEEALCFFRDLTLRGLGVETERLPAPHVSSFEEDDASLAACMMDEVSETFANILSEAEAPDDLVLAAKAVGTLPETWMSLLRTVEDHAVTLPHGEAAELQAMISDLADARLSAHVGPSVSVGP